MEANCKSASDFQATLRQFDTCILCYYSFTQIICLVFDSEMFWFGLLSGHLLENKCSLGCLYVFFVFGLFVILVISLFGFEGLISVLIASVPDLCIVFSFYF